jgi:hypothetical protein
MKTAKSLQEIWAEWPQYKETYGSELVSTIVYTYTIGIYEAMPITVTKTPLHVMESSSLLLAWPRM